MGKEIVAVVHGRETNTTIQDTGDCSENENHVSHHATYQSSCNSIDKLV